MVCVIVPNKLLLIPQSLVAGKFKSAFSTERRVSVEWACERQFRQLTDDDAFRLQHSHTTRSLTGLHWIRGKPGVRV